jgi:hypothetical protein
LIASDRISCMVSQEGHSLAFAAGISRTDVASTTFAAIARAITSCASGQLVIGDVCATRLAHVSTDNMAWFGSKFRVLVFTALGHDKPSKATCDGKSQHSKQAYSHRSSSIDNQLQQSTNKAESYGWLRKLQKDRSSPEPHTSCDRRRSVATGQSHMTLHDLLGCDRK